MKRILSIEEIKQYAKNNESYYDCNPCNFHVGDVVTISNDISHDYGYKNTIGIVESWSGVNNYLYVVAYDERAKRYWACGFEEKDLSLTGISLEGVSKELYDEYCYWITGNGSSFLPKENKNRKDLINLKLTKEEYDAIPVLISMSQIYLWDLYNKTEDDKFYEQHRENIDLIKEYHNKGYQGIMANASEILKRII